MVRAWHRGRACVDPVPLVLTVLTGLVYLPVLRQGWVYDDANWLPDGVGTKWALAPFRWASWIGSGEPWALHALGLVAHLACGWLLWSIGRRWISRVGMSVALTLFWLHPIQVETVAYASGSLEAVIACYGLMAVWLWRSDAPWRQVAAFGFLGLAWSVKWSAWPLPLALYAVGATSIGVDWLIPVIVVVIAGIAWHPSVLFWLSGTLHHLPAFGVRLALTGAELTRGLLWMLWPWRLAVEHAPLVSWQIAVGAVAWIGLGVAAWRQQAARMAWIWVTVLELPRALSAESRPLTEHHWYLPAIAVWLLAGYSVDMWKGAYGRSASVQCG